MVDSNNFEKNVTLNLGGFKKTLYPQMVIAATDLRLGTAEPSDPSKVRAVVRFGSVRVDCLFRCFTLMYFLVPERLLFMSNRTPVPHY